MPDETIDAAAVIRRFSAWMEAHGRSQTEAARMIGVSPATLSQVIAAKYVGNTGRVVAAMSRALDRASRREGAPVPPPFAMTSVAEEVLAVLATAHSEACMALIQGRSGCGKTRAAMRYIEAEPDTIYYAAIPGRRDRHSGARPMIQALTDVLRLDIPTHASTSAAMSKLVETLRGTDRLIVIDEADYLDEISLQALRMIHERAHCGLALLATPAMLDWLKHRRTGTVQQILNRLAYCVHLNGLVHDDAVAMLSPLGWDTPTIEAAYAGSGGVARRLVFGALAAQRRAARSGAKITPQLVARAYGDLMPLDSNKEK